MEYIPLSLEALKSPSNTTTILYFGIATCFGSFRISPGYTHNPMMVENARNRQLHQNKE